ncbi:MAG TPA: NTP transferase domain-containing protein, partial [Gemmatimonadaceae bacterium]|nr:NTP transferase domain-containing protein [Gemmatimonadaceae bacterium]
GAEAIGDAVNPLCGDAIELFLTIESNRVSSASFVADACAICIASASIVTEALRGMPVGTALGLSTDDAVGWLGDSIPAARRRCASLPLEALARALGANAIRRRQHPVFGLVLAAGSASRFGGHKLTARLRGEPVIRRSVRAMVGAVDHVVVVVGADDGPVREALAEIDATIVVNDRWSDGMSRSIRVGVEAAVAGAAGAAIVALGDQPMVSPTVPRELRTAWLRGHRAVVVPRYSGVRGHPVLFDRSVFSELERLEGDAGARRVVEADAARVEIVEFEGPAPSDIDTTEDLAALSAPRAGASEAG